MARKHLQIEHILTILSESPQCIATLTTGLAPAQLRVSPDHDEWPLNNVLAHLRSCADIWGDCMLTIIAEDHPVIRAVNPTSCVKKTDYRDLAFQSSCCAFTAQRRDLLATLEPFQHEVWSRAATVTGAGKPLKRTVQFLRRLVGTPRAITFQANRTNRCRDAFVAMAHDGRRELSDAILCDGPSDSEKLSVTKLIVI